MSGVPPDKTAQPADPTDERSGPPGSAIFSLERRPGAGLYLVAWLLSGAGVALTFIGIQSQPGLPRLLVLLGLVVLTMGLAAAAGYQTLARAARPQTAYRGPSPVLLFFLVVVVTNLFGGVIAVVTGGNSLDVDRPDIFLVGLLIQVACYFGVVGLFVVGSRALSWREMANAAEKSAWQIAGDVAASASIMLPLTLFVLIAGSLVALLLDARPPQVVPVPDTALETLIAGAGAILLAPIGEELFFRGFALKAWWRDLGPRAAIIRSAAFFALVHVLNVQAEAGQVEVGIRSAVVLLIVLVPVGLLLGWLYVKRGLAGSITGHMTYNGIVFGLLLLSPVLPQPAGWAA